MTGRDETTNAKQRPAASRWILYAAQAGLILAAVCLWRWGAGLSSRSPDKTLEQWIPLIERNETDAVSHAVQAASKHWPECAPTVHRMLRHANWRVRVAACRILAEPSDPACVGMLFSRAGDADWRVRTAAFDGLWRIEPLPDPIPLRDTPLEERERLLLRWIERYDALAERPILPDLCEWNAEANHLEFAQPLTDRCLACHAGPQPSPYETMDRCASCHADIHDQWSRSAHAQSLSHLKLPTVNPDSRQTEFLGFGNLRGINCTACHRPAASTSLAGREERCPFSFRTPTSETCAQCHAATYREWKTWRKKEQPRRKNWPPGEIELRPPGDIVGCAKCHMPKAPASKGNNAASHHWSARRSPEFLRSGISVRVIPLAGEKGLQRVRLTLTNLSGHAFPTGSRRRAVRLYAGEPEKEKIITTLSPARLPKPWRDAQPSLAPGEQRSYILTLPPDTDSIRYRLTYCRNQNKDADAETEFLSHEFRLGLP
jgi:hypothetical protein